MPCFALPGHPVAAPESCLYPADGAAMLPNPARFSPVDSRWRLGHRLEQRGCDLRDALWSARVLLDNLELIRAVHHDYFAAGADVATTASYQASYEGFARRGLSAEQPPPACNCRAIGA